MSMIMQKFLSFVFDSVTFDSEVVDVHFNAKDADGGLVTFAAARAGGTKQHTIVVEAGQNPSALSFWDRIYSHAGDINVAGTYKPYGDIAASAAKPWFSFVVTSIPDFDGDYLGDKADVSSSASPTFTVTMDLAAKPTRVTS